MKFKGLLLFGSLSLQMLIWLMLARQMPDIPTEVYFHRYTFDVERSVFERLDDQFASNSRTIRLELDAKGGQIRRIVDFSPAKFIVKSRNSHQEILLLGETTFGLRSLRNGLPVSETPDLIRCPGKQHAVVNHRFLVGCDEENFYVCDTQSAHRELCISRNTLSQTVELEGISGWNRFYAILPSDFDAAEPLSVPANLVAPANRQGTPQTVALFSVDQTGVQLLSSWTALDNGSSGMTFPDPLLASLKDRLVSLSADGISLEYRSNEDGRLLESLATPEGFFPGIDPWSFQKTQFHFGDPKSFRVYDLIRRRFFKLPTQRQHLARRIADAELSWFFLPVERRTNRRTVQGTWNIFDERSNRMVASIPSTRGNPIWTHDPQRLAIGSSRFGFSIEEIDLASGGSKLLLAPLRPLFVGLLVLITLYALWSLAWWRFISKAAICKWILVPGILLPLAITFYYRLSVLAYPSSEFGGGYDVFEQLFYGISYGSVFAILVLLWMQPLRFAAKVWGSLFCMAAAVSLERFLEYRTPLDPNFNEWIMVLTGPGELAGRFCTLLAILLVATGFFRRLGWQIQKIHATNHQPERFQLVARLGNFAYGTPEKSKASVQILDWILATAAFAWLVSALSGRLDGESLAELVLYLPNSLSLSLLAASMVCLLAMAGALSPSRRLFWFCACLFVSLGLISVLQPVLDFAWTCPPLVELMNVDEMRSSLVMPCVAWLYFLALRHSHFRLERVIGTQSDSESAQMPSARC
ncbi:MAG: hypothetical protein NXI32_13755 [bacterium]|nr:hypothetical protein [bacterium]